MGWCHCQEPFRYWPSIFLPSTLISPEHFLLTSLVELVLRWVSLCLPVVIVCSLADHEFIWGVYQKRDTAPIKCAGAGTQMLNLLKVFSSCLPTRFQSYCDLFFLVSWTSCPQTLLWAWLGLKQATSEYEGGSLLLFVCSSLGCLYGIDLVVVSIAKYGTTRVSLAGSSLYW
jgi:hypothetical protein